MPGKARLRTKVEHKRQLLVFGAVALLFCAGGVVAVMFSVRLYAETRRFLSRAESAEGRVVEMEKTRESNRERGTRYTYTPVILFTTKAGGEVRFKGPPRTVLVKLEEGDTVRLFYDPDAPEDARVDSFAGLWFGAAILLAVGAAAIFIPALTMWQAWKWAKREGKREGA